MATINKNLQIFFYNGADLTLAAAPWKSNVNKVFRITDAGTGWQSFVPSSSFNAVTRLLAGSFYFCDANTLPFDIEGATLSLMQAPNVLPVANAGNDITITSPANQVLLIGSGIDTDGTVVSYDWSQITGPNIAVLASANAPNTTASGLTSGVYQFRLTVTDNRSGTRTDDVLVTVNNAPTERDFNLATSLDFDENIWNISQGNYNLRSAFATVSFSTNATTVEVSFISAIGLTGYWPLGNIGVYINGGYNQSISCQNSGGVITAIISLPAGVKTLKLVEAGATDSSSTTFIGTSITRVVFPQGSENYLMPSVGSATRMVVEGDSISIGDGTSNSLTNSWVQLLRNQRNHDIATIGWGGKYAVGAYPDASSQQLVVNKIVAYLAGATEKIFWWALGTNDYGYAANPAQLSSVAASIFDKIHAADPAVKIYVQPPFWRGEYDTSNGAGFKPGAYALALKDVTNTRSWTTFVPANTWLTAGDLNTDLLHPTDAGNVKIRDRVQDVLLNGVSGLDSSVTVLQGERVEENDPRVKYVGSWNRITGIPDASGGAIMLSETIGDYYEVPFNGQQIRFFFSQDGGAGVSRIFIDDIFLTSFSYSAPPSGSFNNHFTTPAVSPGNHILRVEKAATGYVWLDAIEVLTGGNNAAGNSW